MIVPTTVVSGMDGILGCDYLLKRNQLLFVESDGDILLINLATPNPPATIGTGYQTLQDIKISRDNQHAYVTGGQGNLMCVDLNNANFSPATVIAAGMTEPRQIVLDEDHQVAYVVEFAQFGRLLRVDLKHGHLTQIATGLHDAVGLLMTADGKFAYVSEQTAGAITRIQLATGNREPVVKGLNKPSFLTWLGTGEDAILATEQEPANRVVRIDLTKSPATSSEIATVPYLPASVAVVAGNQLYVCSDQVVSRLALTSFGPGDPILMGIGNVPVSMIGTAKTPDIPVGMATTDPGYFFRVVDAPFGGSLPLMINHEAARHMTPRPAKYYRILVDGVELPVAQFSDYRWNNAKGLFELVANPLPPGPYYEVRAAGEVWYNAWLGSFVDSTAQPFFDIAKKPGSLFTIAVRLFDANQVEIGTIDDLGRAVEVMIDNGLPIASIDKILHNGVEVPVCAIEHLGVDQWTFQITARDAEKHLGGWGLSAVWGANQSGSVASGSYVHNPTGQWEGLPPDTQIVPHPVAWQAKVAKDPSSTNCAHTFILSVWDRVIDGWNHLHSAGYTKSFTIIP